MLYGDVSVFQFSVLEKIEAWLGFTRPEMIDVLYRTNGSVDDAVHWILHGVMQNGKHQGRMSGGRAQRGYYME